MPSPPSADTPDLFDTHAHLDDEKFRDDLPEVLERARSTGLTRVVTIGTTALSSGRCVDLVRQFPLLRATVGIQPNNVAESKPGDWDAVIALAGADGVVGLGETGLDRHWQTTPFPQQEDYFVRHLELARERNLPVVIHCREAEADVLRVLRMQFDQFGPIRGVMHSFTGDRATAEACMAMGLYISFAGMVTFANAQNLRDVARRVLVDRLLVETDSPYLAPVPVRGRRNESAFVRHTVECLAGLRGVSPAELACITSKNARELFSI